MSTKVSKVALTAERRLRKLLGGAYAVLAYGTRGACGAWPRATGARRTWIAGGLVVDAVVDVHEAGDLQRDVAEQGQHLHCGLRGTSRSHQTTGQWVVC